MKLGNQCETSVFRLVCKHTTYVTTNNLKPSTLIMQNLDHNANSDLIKERLDPHSSCKTISL